MKTEQFQAIVLAAGKSTRFNTVNTKLSFTICGQEMIVYPVKLLSSMNIPIVLIVGYQKEIIQNVLEKNSLTDLTYVNQEIQSGTGHALLCSQKYWFAENILIINGDVPLINEDIINKLISKHINANAAISFITAHNSDPLGSYGRVIKSCDTIEIVESKNYTGDISANCCINAGIYIFKRKFLEHALPELERDCKTNELYITDLVKMASNSKEIVETLSVDFDQVRGINTLKELWAVEQIKRSELIGYWMHQGVRFLLPQTVHLDLNVSIGSDTVIGAGVQLRNSTVIGNNCFIDASSVINNSIIQDNVKINPCSIVSDSKIFANATIGPFAHIQNNSSIGKDSYIGNFVEISKSKIGNESKAKHLSYIGNTQVGSKVNIGAGTITCNYNGVTKEATEIKDNAFIGSNSSLVAPVIIGDGAIVGAGSVITQDVPDDALALSRNPQINKNFYAHKLKEKYISKQESNSKDYAELKVKETIAEKL